MAGESSEKRQHRMWQPKAAKTRKAGVAAVAYESVARLASAQSEQHQAKRNEKMSIMAKKR